MTASSSDIIPVDWQRWSTSKPTLVKLLPGGLTNQSFLLSADGIDLVLRKNSPLSDALNLDRATEAQVLRLADQATLCAPLVYCDTQHQYLVTRYIEGRHWHVGTDNLKQLAHLLGDIHQLPAIEAELDINDKISNYWLSIDSHSEVSFMPKLQSLDNKIRPNIARAESFNAGSVLCHNDLLVENLLVAAGGKLYAIDWEYASMGDAFYDLAVVVEGNGLNRQQQQRLLTEYLDHSPTDIDWQRLYLWRLIYRYLAVLWYTVQWSSGSITKINLKDLIADQIDALSQLMEKGRDL